MTIRTVSHIIVVVFAVFWLAKEILVPGLTALVWSHAFLNLTNECDEAMEANWYYTQDNAFDNKSEIVQLLSCHEYDKVRKLMLMSGLPEAYLSWLSLRSLELHQRSPEEFVTQHRFWER